MEMMSVYALFTIGLLFLRVAQWGMRVRPENMTADQKDVLCLTLLFLSSTGLLYWLASTVSF
jgi:hypothetical protein